MNYQAQKSISVKIAPYFIFEPLLVVVHECWVQLDLALHLIQKIGLAYHIKEALARVLLGWVRLALLLRFLLLGVTVFLAAKLALGPALLASLSICSLRLLRCLILLALLSILLVLLVFIEELVVFIIEVRIDLSNLLLGEPLLLLFNALLTIAGGDARLLLLLPSEPIVQLPELNMLVHSRDDLHVVLPPVL